MQNLPFYEYEYVFFDKRELSVCTVTLILILLAIIVRQQDDMWIYFQFSMEIVIWMIWLVVIILPDSFYYYLY